MLIEVDKLLQVVQKQQRYPEMVKVTRVLGGNRPEVNMWNVASSSWGWYSRGTPFLVHMALNEAYSVYNQSIGRDPRSSSVNPKYVIRYIQASQKAISFAKQVENAYLDATRSHQEQFFGARMHEDLYTSLETDVRAAQNYLWDV